METIDILKVVIAAAVAAWEVLSRIIPTEGKWSLIGKILEILTKISDVFDKRKNK